MAGGRSTINTVLKSGTTTSELTKLCKIKTYPQLGGSPEKIETTDLEDIMQTFVEGVQSVDDMQFTVNYRKRNIRICKGKGQDRQVFPTRIWRKRKRWNFLMVGFCFTVCKWW